MAADVVLVLQGGGALGAFECGVWKVLAPALQAGGHRLAVVGGASIGALNAAVIAQHHDEPDRGAAALECFWREWLATPSLPFLPMPGTYFEAWNGLLTGLLWGNRSMYRPQFLNWTPMAAPYRIARPFFDTEPMHAMLRALLGGETFQPTPGAPTLFLRSTDLLGGTARTFHSGRDTLTAGMLRASGAMPILFPAVDLDGRPHVDGDAGTHTALVGALDVLRDLGSGAFSDPDGLLLIHVELHQRTSPQTPRTGLEMTHRLLNALQAGKAEADLRLLRAETEHAQLLRQLDLALVGQRDSTAARLVRRELARLRLRRAPQALPRIVQIGREALPHEHVSNYFDYSPRRIDALIRQGMQEARQTLCRELPHLAPHLGPLEGEAADEIAPAGAPQRLPPRLRVV